MKIEKPRHDHKLTDLLKVCIFSLLMLAPLVASCSQWLYATINKNAYHSYYGETINQSEEVNLQNQQIKTNTTYHFYANENTTNNINGTILNLTILSINYVGTDNQTNALKTNIDLINNLYFFVNNDVQYIQFRKIDNTLIGSNVLVNTSLIDFEYQYISSSNTNLYTFLQLNSYVTKYNNYSYLDNAFYYGVDQMTKSELFNWTQNTALYNGIKAMTDNLQIQTNAIAILLTYWFILTIIYIIVDIVLKLFTTITHLGTKD